MGSCVGRCSAPFRATHCLLAILTPPPEHTAVIRVFAAMAMSSTSGETPMNESLKVQSHHLERDAYLYIRQSSMQQVLENIESTKRQYALRGRATALGWADDRIVVDHSDQGESGASAAWGEGFQRLVTDVGMGRAGIVMGLEVSRLARNNADWHRLLEICALADTLILDEDGVYDPTDFNDRLLLGLKGTMSEAELHVLKARLRGGILNKVRRGEYRCAFPPASSMTRPATCARSRRAGAGDDRPLLRHLRARCAVPNGQGVRNEGLQFPLVSRTPTTCLPTADGLGGDADPAQPALRRRLCVRTAAYRRTIDGKKTVQRKRDHDDWLACIPNAHPGYITWELFQENLKLLETNGHGYDAARASPPREGTALLQGRAVCGRCGKHFRVRYAARARTAGVLVYL